MAHNTSALHQDRFSHNELKEMIARHVPPARVPKKINILTDTTDFFRIDYDDVLILNERPYLIRNYEKEGRFGIDDQPKHWVRRAIDLYSGETKIIKMVFLEKYTAKVGSIIFDCVRSPQKESRILDLVRDHPHFMHGISISDSAGNNIRIIDYIRGKTMAETILDLGTGHEDYFYNHFPAVLNDFITLVEAIAFLHKNGEKHGDIRRDHIIKDKHANVYRWIDFDYNYWHHENIFGYDLFGLGNILVYLSGQGDITTQDLKRKEHPASGQLTSDDRNIIFNNRIVNLKKIYPYIPHALNLMLLHFSEGAETFYEDTGQFLNDLYETRNTLCQPK